MNNTTGIDLSGGNFNVKEFGSTATNNNYSFANAVGVEFAKDDWALNGSVGLNMGNNSTKSIIAPNLINGVDKLNVFATDNTSKTTIGGDITISYGGNVAAGGSVAYANIGSTDDKEIVNAKLANAVINTNNNATIDVESLDSANITTVAVGAGGSINSGKLTFQGAAAVSELNKDNLAEISNAIINQNSTNNADVKIISTSGANTSEGLTVGNDKLGVNNKVKTAAAVLDADFSSDSWFDGAAAVTVNKFNQTSSANFKNDSRPTTASNLGNVNMFSNSEADILGVAVGGAGGKSVISAAGSTSYNYINNSAKTLVENENVKANKNFGVVSQSDDKISNYAGAVNIDFKGRGTIGVSVAYNDIKGNTESTVKNSKLDVAGSNNDLIAISNPKDNLIDGYVTRNNWISSRLMDGRQSDNKSGLVVNSSATHSISSDLATLGIRIDGSKFGVGASGTVNINKIGGNTNATVENTDVDGNANSFVNASDFTNNGSFIGNAAVSGSVAIGMLWNENKVTRQTNALVDGGTLNVKNIDVKADSRQAISNLNIAVGTSFTASGNQVFAAASGDNVVRNQLEGTTSAKIKNATVNHSGNVEVNAYHKDIAYATNIGAGIAVDAQGAAGATFDLGYGLMREKSTVDAEILNSTLTGKTGTVNVNAENQTKLAGAFGTLGVAVHIGKPGASIAGAVGINNNYIQNTVSAAIRKSNLDVGNVNVNAQNSSEVKADGGVAAVSLNISKAFIASLGSATAVTNATFDNKVTAEVDNSTINASGDVNVKSRDDHKADETVVSAALSTGLAVSVNRMAISINSGLADLKANQLGKALGSNDLVMNTNNASKANSDSDSSKLTGEFGDEKRFLNSSSINDLLNGVHADSTATKNDIKTILNNRIGATVNYNNTLKSGVYANVTNNSNITANNKISIDSTENNNLSVTSGGGTGGIIGVGVGSTSIKNRRANISNVTSSTLTAKNIDINTTNGQVGNPDYGIKSRMYNATLTGIGASVGYNNVDTNGTGEILISNSNITATDNINANATDNATSKTYILDAGFKGAGYTGVFAYNNRIRDKGDGIRD